jgi:putative oxidoreductase
MKNITTAGRFLFAIPFALFGLNHFLMLDYYLGMLTSFIPFGAYTIVLTGLLLIGISISIMTRWYIKQAAYTLAALLLIFILAIHVPHLISTDDRTVALITLLKDTSLMGGSLMIAGMCQEKPVTKG